MITLISPVLTEKTMKISEKRPEYVFKVRLDATKIEIRRAIEKKFNVKVADIRTMTVLGKQKSQYTKTGVRKGKNGDYKKAVVGLVEGQTIDYQNVQQTKEANAS